ncbi:MAG: hypothetical protein ABIO79_02330 [Ferruginibacter sp.]
MATKRTSTKKIIKKKAIKKEPVQKKIPSVKPKAVKAEAPRSIFDLSYILNPLVANNEAVVKSSLSSTDLDIKQGSQASGHVKTWSEHDEGNHLKLFLDASNKNSIFKLSPRAMTLYVWILYTLSHKTDIITIEPKEVSSEIAMTENTVRLAIKDMEEAKLIYRIGITRGAELYHDFYVNSLFMFRGRRFHYYRRFLAKYKMYRNDQDRDADSEED